MAYSDLTAEFDYKDLLTWQNMDALAESDAAIKGGDIDGPILCDLGAVGAPTYTFTGDTDTGMYSSGANVLDFSTAGVNRISIGATGNVGIGTPSPASKIHSSGSGAADVANIRIENTTNDAGYTAAIQMKTGNSSNIWQVFSRAGDLFFGVAAVADYMVIKSGGNVGIGTAAPLGRLCINGGLHVGGDSDPGDNNLLVDGTLAVAGAVTFNDAGADVDVRMEGVTNSNLFFLDASADRIGIGTSGSPGYTLQVGPTGTTFAVLDGSSNIAFYVNGTTFAQVWQTLQCTNEFFINTTTSAAIYIKPNGTEQLRIDPSSGVIANETGSATFDFRIEGDTDENCFLLDASADMVSIASLHVGGTSDPGDNNLLVDGTLEVTGAVTLTSGILFGSGAAATPSITFSGDTNTGIYAPAADSIGLTTNGTLRVTVSSTGKVGIKEASPASMLHIEATSVGDSEILIDTGSSTKILEVLFPSGGVTYGPNAANSLLYLGADSGTSRSVNATGTVNASGADYAEWVLWKHKKPEQGDIINYMGCNMVVSSPAIAGFTGNDRFDEKDSILLSFMGQVPVCVIGPVKAGDYILPNQAGIGYAVDPDEITFEQYRKAVGVAWQTDDSNGKKKIICAVGVK